MSEAEVVTRDKLVADLKVVIADAEELLRATAGQAGDKAEAVRKKIQDNLIRAKETLADTQATVVGKAKAAGRATDEYVSKHPWQSVGIAAGVGLVVGLLVGRR
ncbi:MAG: DUF883 family protein [Gallionellaceae bacterium]|jgi:ElaB/YqjD/DUF883 family membrane-anchored ribosome-binding protein|nr:DUF883 family protein [Gallionellaceae bacterium]